MRQTVTLWGRNPDGVFEVVDEQPNIVDIRDRIRATPGFIDRWKDLFFGFTEWSDNMSAEEVCRRLLLGGGGA